MRIDRMGIISLLAALASVVTILGFFGVSNISSLGKSEKPVPVPAPAPDSGVFGQKGGSKAPEAIVREQEKPGAMKQSGVRQGAIKPDEGRGLPPAPTPAQPKEPEQTPTAKVGPGEKAASVALVFRDQTRDGDKAPEPHKAAERGTQPRRALASGGGLREKAYFESNIVARIEAGDTVVLEGEADANGWVSVRHESTGRRGYLRSGKDFTEVAK